MDKATVKAATGSNTYLNTVGRVPLLTPQQEIELGRKVQRMEQLQVLDRELTPEEQREVKMGKRALDRFVKANLRLVVMVAKKYHRNTHSLDFMDLVQEGNAGLINGVRKFDPTRGYKFSTYAYWWIRQAMVRAIRYKDRTIRLPGNVGDMAYTWSNKVSQFQVETGRVPTRQELAEMFKVSVDDVDLFLDRGAHVSSLDKVLHEGDGSSLIELVADHNNLNSQEVMEKALYGEATTQLETALCMLLPREQDMVRRRWGLDGNGCGTLAEIGEEHGVSRERARQVLDLCYRKMRRTMVLTGARAG